MERRCVVCGKHLGHKEPLDDHRITHGYCETCLFLIESTEALRDAILQAPEPTGRAADADVAMLDTVASMCRSIERLRAFWREFGGGKPQRIREVTNCILKS